MTAADRPALVLVPGLLCDEDLYAPQSAALSEVADVVVPDIRPADSIEQMARAVLDAAPERFALAGLSLGGYVVLEVVRQARSRVTRVALLDTSARPESPEQTARRRALLQLVDDQGLDAGLEALWPTEVAPGRVTDAALHERFLAMCRRSGRDVLVRQVQAIMARPDSRPDLPHLDLPLLVLCGRQDAITPLDGHEEMARLAPRARLVVLDDCGHLSSWEQPEAVTSELRRWLTDDPAQPPRAALDGGGGFPGAGSPVES
jgi:pimeloyl-ACP methyl ester carboxylesterase